MFQRVFPFLFFLPSPCPAAMRPQSRCEKFFSLIRHLYRLHCSVPHRRSLPSCDTADISARQSPQTPLLFRTEDFPCVLPVCKRPKSALIVRAGLSLLLDKQAAQRLSAAFARIPALPRPAAVTFWDDFLLLSFCIQRYIVYLIIHDVFVLS